MNKPSNSPYFQSFCVLKHGSDGSDGGDDSDYGGDDGGGDGDGGPSFMGVAKQLRTL